MLADSLANWVAVSLSRPNSFLNEAKAIEVPMKAES